MATTFLGSVSTFRILGSAATPQPLFTIENTAGSAVTVLLRRIAVLMDATAVLTSVMPLIKAARSTAVPSNGTVLAKGSFDTTLSSAANVICRGANASDGGVASAITVTPGDIMWEQFGMRLHTAVGQVQAPDNSMIPTLCETIPIKIPANAGFVVTIVAPAGASNPATNHYFVNCMWEETTP